MSDFIQFIRNSASFHICATYANSYQLPCNATKSFLLCFRPKQIKINPTSLVLGKQFIPTVDKFRYLGIIVSETK